MEMPGRGKRGNPKVGFPLFPPPLEIAKRDSHIPTGTNPNDELQLNLQPEKTPTGANPSDKPIPNLNPEPCRAAVTCARMKMPACAQLELEARGHLRERQGRD
jgi:hypothetical protein